MTNIFSKYVSVRFALPAQELRPYVSAYSWTQLKPLPTRDWIEDILLPSWANVWIGDGSWEVCKMGDTEVQPASRLSITGPTTQAGYFRSRGGRIWSIGLMPLGWASFFDVKACDYANISSDGLADDAFSAFRPLSAALSASSGEFEEELALVEAHVAKIQLKQSSDEAMISAINEALIEPKLAAVNDLVDKTGLNIRTLERVSKRAFGFSPQTLLRRQRFLRSLAKFMITPSSKWREVLDDQYYDQAQFSRDFKIFMTMGPREYAKRDRPIFDASVRAREAMLGKAVQALHSPDPSKSD